MKLKIQVIFHPSSGIGTGRRASKSSSALWWRYLSLCFNSLGRTEFQIPPPLLGKSVDISNDMAFLIFVSRNSISDIATSMFFLSPSVFIYLYLSLASTLINFLSLALFPGLFEVTLSRMGSFETFLQQFKLSSLIGFGVIKVAAFACNAKGFIIARVFFLHTPPCFSNGLPNLFCQCFISRYEEACNQDWTYKCNMPRALEVNSNRRFKGEHYKIALQPLKTYLYYHNAYGHQTCQGGDLP